MHPNDGCYEGITLSLFRFFKQYAQLQYCSFVGSFWSARQHVLVEMFALRALISVKKQMHDTVTSRAYLEKMDMFWVEPRHIITTHEQLSEKTKFHDKISPCRTERPLLVFKWQVTVAASRLRVGERGRLCRSGLSCV